MADNQIASGLELEQILQFHYHDCSTSVANLWCWIAVQICAEKNCKVAIVPLSSFRSPCKITHLQKTLLKEASTQCVCLSVDQQSSFIPPGQIYGWHCFAASISLAGISNERKATNGSHCTYMPNQWLIWTLLQQNLEPTKCKVPTTKVLALCNMGRLPTIISIALPLSSSWLFSDTRGVSLRRIAKAMEWRL
jgi:hypothetical protein